MVIVTASILIGMAIGCAIASGFWRKRKAVKPELDEDDPNGWIFETEVSTRYGSLSRGAITGPDGWIDIVIIEHEDGTWEYRVGDQPLAISYPEDGETEEEKEEESDPFSDVVSDIEDILKGDDDGEDK